MCSLVLTQPCPADSLFLGICYSTIGEVSEHKRVLIKVILLPQTKGKVIQGHGLNLKVTQYSQASQ